MARLVLHLVLTLIGLFHYLVIVNTLDNGVALKPPMGWITTKRNYLVAITEQSIKNVADVMVSKGYKDLGYEYIIINDDWDGGRNAKNEVIADPKRFPNGMKALGDYIHSKGLKFGIRSIGMDVSTDAQTYANWGIDYVKQYIENFRSTEYLKFGDELKATGRPIIYCCHEIMHTTSDYLPALNINYELVKEHCNLYKYWIDGLSTWGSIRSLTNSFAIYQDKLQPLAGPGSWNDPSVLVIGNGRLSIDQSKYQMAIYAVLAAPLIMSNDLNSMGPELQEILQNKEIIAVNQDPLGIQGLRVKNSDMIETWVRPIIPVVNGLKSYAVAFGNLRSKPYTMDVKISDLDFEHNCYEIINLYDSNVSLGVMCDSESIPVSINPTGVVFYKFIVHQKPVTTARCVQPITDRIKNVFLYSRINIYLDDLNRKSTTSIAMNLSSTINSATISIQSSQD